MNKNDVLKIIEAIASDPFFKEYVIKKKDASIILKSDIGYKRVVFQYYNTYDLKRDNLAIEIKPNYDIRFNILHKWFEKYSKRTLADQRDDYSVGFIGDMIGATNEFFFLESRQDYYTDLQALYDEVVKNAKNVFSKFTTLENYYDYCVNDVLTEKWELIHVGFEWVTEYLIATKLVAPSNYETVKNLILKRVEWMLGRDNPNIKLYYDDLPMILEDLESTDFTSGKWGKLPA